MEQKQIQIDLEIYKALESLRRSFDESYNDILRREFLPTVRPPCGPDGQSGGLRVGDGVYLKAGTRLRAILKRSGKLFEAVVGDGGIEYEGGFYQSPSKAARAATGGTRNGWTFWEYFDEDLREWRVLDELRRE